MRLGLAVLSAAVVIGGYTLVNTIQSRPADSEPGAETASETLRSWMPGAIDEPAVETRSFELIRFMNPDGSFGMVDDARRVPPGATILGRERKQVAAAKPAPAERAPEAEVAPEPEESVDPALPPGAGRRLSAAERRVMEAVLKSGVMPDASQLEQMQGDLDALEAEREAAR